MEPPGAAWGRSGPRSACQQAQASLAGHAAVQCTPQHAAWSVGGPTSPHAPTTIPTSPPPPPPQGLRPGSVILMGKNTMMKRSIRLYCETTGDKKWLALLEHMVMNVGIVFTNADLSDVKAEIDKYKARGGRGGGWLAAWARRGLACAWAARARTHAASPGNRRCVLTRCRTRCCTQVGAPARVGIVAPVDVHVQAGPTGMDPSQTSFFQVRRGSACACGSALGQARVQLRARSAPPCTPSPPRTPPGPGHRHQDYQGYH